VLHEDRGAILSREGFATAEFSRHRPDRPATDARDITVPHLPARMGAARRDPLVPSPDGPWQAKAGCVERSRAGEASRKRHDIRSFRASKAIAGGWPLGRT
jgi:hypothetical protein